MQEGRVQLLVQPTFWALGWLARQGLQPDVIFIDASHDYASVSQDIFYSRGLLMAGGLLCGHDLELPDVQRAVLKSLDQAVYTGVGSLWCWRKPDESL
jgi:hypothetical protein